MIKLLVLDLDGTIWDHLDASSLTPPYTKIGEDIVVDSRGTRVALRRGARWFLAKVYGRIALAVASWNEWSKAYELLRVFGLDHYFGYLGIEPHPNKYLVLEKILKWYKHTYDETLHPDEILYVDDRRIHLEDIYRHIGKIRFLQMRVDIRDFYELYRRLEEHGLG